MRPELRHVVLAGEGDLPGQRLVEDTAQRVDVGTGVDLVTAQLLRRHVVERPHPLSRRGQAALGGASLGEAEIGEVDVLSPAPRGHEHVRRLDVAMYEAALVRRVERGRHLGNDAGRPRRVELALRRDERAQVGPVHESHGDVEDAVSIAGCEHRNHVRMVERRRQSRLPHEAVAERQVVRQAARDHLEGNRSAQGDLHGAVHDAHAAAPHLVFDSEVAEDRARRKHAHPIAGRTGSQTTPDAGLAQPKWSE